MNRDEQKQITCFIEHAVSPAPASLPKVDIEADTIIRALFVRNPEAAYRVTMLALRQARELQLVRDQLAEVHQHMRGGRLTSFLRRRLRNRHTQPFSANH